MLISKELLLSGCNSFGVHLDDVACDRFDKYARLLREYNEKVNLTRITEPDEIVNKHFVDSLALFRFTEIKNGMTVCDVGTGAGFPGAALLITNPELKLTLFDSVNKKLEFLRFLVAELGLTANIITARAEEAGKKPEYREKFNLVTARAVASLNVLSEYCVPLVEKNGVFAPLKAVLSDEEASRGVLAAEKLGAKEKSRNRYKIPDGSEREIIVFEKKSKTPPIFPRNSAQISKKPL